MHGTSLGHASAVVHKVPQVQTAGSHTALMLSTARYNYLLSTYDSMSPADQASAAKAAAALRLTVSGSAACPIATMQRWQHLSGQVLLERYGMTETGMLLSNPYEVRCLQQQQSAMFFRNLSADMSYVSSYACTSRYGSILGAHAACMHT